MNAEVWNPVAGWEGYYSVSNLGRVKRDAGSPRCPKDRLLKPRLHNNSTYLMVSPVREGVKQRPIFIHRLVAAAFIGPAPTESHEVNHINGDKLDNRAENLEWVTRSDNIKHAYDTALHGKYKGSKASAAKLNEAQVVEILQRIANREYRKDLAVEFNISIGMIDEIVLGNHWTHVPRPDMSGKRMGRHVLTEDDVREIRTLVGAMSCRAIGERFGVTAGTIQHIKDGRTWRHVS